MIPDLSPPDGDSDFYCVQAADPETAAVRIVELVKTRIPRERPQHAGTRLETKPAWSGGEAVQCFFLGLEDLEYGE